MATPTAVDVVMPQMGVSVSEGTITKWLKQEGEEIQADEPLLEISTDKVDTEVPSPGSGVVTQILVQEGETVEVGTKLAVIGGEAGGAQAEVGASPQEAPPPEPATQEAGAQAAASSGAESPAPAPVQPESEAAQAPAPEPEPAPAAQAGNGQQADGKSFVSPVVARIASEHGIEPSQVPGTGRGGRVTKKDILKFVESGAAAQAPAPPPAPAPAPAPAPEAPAPAAPAQPPPAPPAAAPAAPAQAAVP